MGYLELEQATRTNLRFSLRNYKIPYEKINGTAIIDETHIDKLLEAIKANEFKQRNGRNDGYHIRFQTKRSMILGLEQIKELMK